MFDFNRIKSPIIFKGGDKTAYRDPAVYFENGRFYLFCTYVECCEDGEKYGNQNSRLFTMKSYDLINWEYPELLKVKGDIPLENMGRMIDPFLVQDMNDPKKWWCLYKQNGVLMSYSYDLKNWTYHGKTASGENVCALKKDGEYLIFHSPQNGIGMLRTKDLVNFETFGEIITLGQEDWDWAKGRLSAGFVLDLKNDPNYGKYIMFFHGSGPEDEETMFDHHASVALAWSDDLKLWQWAGKN